MKQHDPNMTHHETNMKQQETAMTHYETNMN